MTDKIKDFDAAFDEKLKKLSKEERAEAMLKKLAQEMEQNKTEEPEGLASGATDKDGNMIIDLEEDFDDEQ
ncbi:hypothetical protein [Aliikangiella maris]|uniref:Uncharacterized protein n=2 Tax=Aliikangiella maris TaxID=3162458 RepID=A0ABV3MSQ9_9GAMM